MYICNCYYQFNKNMSMKRTITYLMCATLFAASSYAYNQVAPVETFKMRTPAEAQQQNQFGKKQAKAVDANTTLKQKAMARSLEKGMQAKSVRPMVTEFSSTPVAAPFTCDFSTEASFTDNWVITDANNDSYTWEYDNGSFGFGAAALWYNADDNTIGSDDYMITASPVTMVEGDSYISLQFGGASSYFYESIEVYYGTTTDVSQMKKIAEYIDYQGGYIYSDVIEFTVPADGDYHFAIHGCSQADQLGAFVSYVNIVNAAYVPTPDIIITDIVAPIASPELTSSEQIEVTVGNAGDGNIGSFSLSWSAECNGSTQVSPLNTFNTPIAAGETATVTLEMPIDMSAEGVYEITVNAECTPADGSAEEAVTTNNSATASTTHFGTTNVPSSTDFSDGEQPLEWNSNGGWSYVASYEGLACIDTEPLYSQGYNLEAGKSYRITFGHMAGEYSEILPGWGQEYPDTYYILAAKAGEEFAKIFEASEYSGYEFINGEAIYKCYESGVYQFAFMQDEPYGTFILQNVSITELDPYDLELTAITGAPTMVPTAQAAEVNAYVAINNRGSMTVTGNIEIAADGTTVATIPFDELESDIDAMVKVTFPLTSIAAGKTATITATAVIDGQQDSNTDDNSASTTITVTDDVLAYDNTADDQYTSDNSIGSTSGTGIVAGIPVHVSADDVITGISIGWGQVFEQEISLTIYKCDSEPIIAEDYYGEYAYYELGEAVYTGTAQQGSEIGQIDYPIEATTLPAGDYMICVGFADYCIICDGSLNDMLYAIDGNIAYMQTGLGTPTIRGIFGESSGISASQVGDTSLKLYPNPASETLTITGKQIESVTIYSATGAAVATVAADADTVSYDVTGLAAGIYFANVKSAAGTEVIKFIVK